MNQMSRRSLTAVAAAVSMALTSAPPAAGQTVTPPSAPAVTQGGAAAADPLPRATPESVGMSSERLARIGPFLREEVERNRMPGAVLAIARRGRLVHYEAVGYLDRERGIPMPLDAIFQIASMTKPLVGVATMMLVEEGRVALGDPVERYLPQLADRRVAVLSDAVQAGQGPIETVPAKRSITLLDLGRHTSGIPYGVLGTTAVHRLYPTGPAEFWTMTGAEFLDQIAPLPLLHQPGTVWQYGLSIDVLGLVVERVSGQSLGAFLQQRLFGPLGMRDSGFAIPPGSVARRARTLPLDPLTGRPERELPDATRPPRFECGGACGVSTAGDYLRFAQMLLDGGRLGETRILGPRAVAMMTRDHLTPAIRNDTAGLDPTREGYGWGITVAVRGPTGGQNTLGNPGDFSWSGGFGTNFWVDPQEGLAVVFMAQTPGQVMEQIRRQMNGIVYGAIME